MSVSHDDTKREGFEKSQFQVQDTSRDLELLDILDTSEYATYDGNSPRRGFTKNDQKDMRRMGKHQELIVSRHRLCLGTKLIIH